jgi:putative sterol carrier protein
MAYTDKPQDFFARLEQEGAALPRTDGIGAVHFRIGGEGGGEWTFDFGVGKRAAPGQQAALTVEAQARDFMALVEGRMTASDGILTERLSVRGDALAATRLSAFLGALATRTA